MSRVAQLKMYGTKGVPPASSHTKKQRKSPGNWWIKSDETTAPKNHWWNNMIGTMDPHLTFGRL